MDKTGAEDFGATPMIDLSKLSIPPLEIMPEPTAELTASVLSLAATAAYQQGPCGVDQVLFSLARRCRALELNASGRFSPEQCEDFDAQVRLNHRIKQLEAQPNAALDWQAKRIAELEDEVERLRKTLKRIAKWKGEFPPTGKFESDGVTPASYGLCYGSNGERDYMRQVAKDALDGR